MNKIRVTGGILHVGQGVIVALTKEQASPRLTAVADMGNGLFKAQQVLQFKSGEVLGIAINDIVKNERHLAVDAAMPVPVKSDISPKTPQVRRGR